MKKNNNHVLCHKIGKNRTSQNNFAFNIFQFILLVILLLKTNYCFGQPSSDSWKEVISKMYTRTIQVSHHKNCVFPFKVGNKYYRPRGKSISKVIELIHQKKFKKMTLSSCIIEKINNSVVIYNEFKKIS